MVVFGISANKANVDDGEFVVYFDNQPKIVAFYVENEAIVGNNAGRAILRFYVVGCGPIGRRNILKPRAQGEFGGGIFFPERPESGFAKDTQLLAKITATSRIGKRATGKGLVLPAL
jgi:hypothetical protein